MELFDIVMKLTGNVFPYGDSRVDADRYNNLKELTHLTGRLIVVLEAVAQSAHSQEASVAKMGKHSANFLSEIRTEP